ncbi:hypothetical protein [Bacillus sp. OK048]|uniref:hypothetical protein n=1 Tax=Bacillus sp. OK048 TaxID=1882761 RepID=UPI001113F1FB|nr:hypothetical protein [Bacillus sp. OK048]
MENRQVQKPNGEIDHFSRLMFGNRKHRETYDEGDNHSKIMPESEKKEQSSFENSSLRNKDWILGFRGIEPATRTQATQNQIENILNNIDVELLMETIDMIVTTSKQLKPLFKEVTPFIHRFIKRFKFNENA